MHDLAENTPVESWKYPPQLDGNTDTNQKQKNRCDKFKMVTQHIILVNYLIRSFLMFGSLLLYNQLNILITMTKQKYFPRWFKILGLQSFYFSELQNTLNTLISQKLLDFSRSTKLKSATSHLIIRIGLIGFCFGYVFMWNK